MREGKVVPGKWIKLYKDWEGGLWALKRNFDLSHWKAPEGIKRGLYDPLHVLKYYSLFLKNYKVKDVMCVYFIVNV